MFIRRGREPNKRWMVARVGLFFAAAGLWLVGVAAENYVVTVVAIGLAAVGIIAGAAGRWMDKNGDEESHPH